MAFCLSLPSHRVSAQAALKKFVDEAVVLHSEPDPMWKSMTEDIISHCYRRFAEHVRGAIGDGGALFESRANIAFEPTVQMYLKYCNGDPRSPVLSHHERGCCSSIEETRTNLFSAIVGSPRTGRDGGWSKG